MAVFAILAMLIFSFALDLRGAVARAAAPGVLWSAIAFASALGLSRSMAREQEGGGMDQLLSPADRTVILFGKALGNLVVMVALEAVLVPLATVLFSVNLLNPGVVAKFWFWARLDMPWLARSWLRWRSTRVLARSYLPILLLPLVVPLLIAQFQATSGLLEGLRWADLRGWTQLLVVYDLLIAAASLLTFETVVEA